MPGNDYIQMVFLRFGPVFFRHMHSNDRADSGGRQLLINRFRPAGPRSYLHKSCQPVFFQNNGYFRPGFYFSGFIIFGDRL